MDQFGAEYYAKLGLMITTEQRSNDNAFYPNENRITLHWRFTIKTCYKSHRTLYNFQLLFSYSVIFNSNWMKMEKDRNESLKFNVTDILKR